MNDLKTYIERGEKQAGGQKALAELLHQHPGNLRGAKAGLKGLPVAVCYQLAELIGEDERRVVAASELITEKKAERRAVLLPFVSHALSILLVAVISIMTTTPTNAAPCFKDNAKTLYIMSNARRMLRRVQQRFLQALMVCRPPAARRLPVLQVDQVTA